MSKTDITTCEFVLEAESAAREARKKATSDWSSPVSMAYYQVSLELRRIVSRHVAKDHCVACKEDEARRRAGAALPAFGDLMPPPQNGANLGISIGVGR
jgi:hypothetical protein